MWVVPISVSRKWIVFQQRSAISDQRSAVSLELKVVVGVARDLRDRALGFIPVLDAAGQDRDEHVTSLLRQVQDAHVAYGAPEGSGLVGGACAVGQASGNAVRPGYACEQNLGNPPGRGSTRGAPGVDRAEEVVHRRGRRGIPQVPL